MLKSLCRWILFKRMGWTTNVTEAHPDKFIICLAPHTSNWDFIIGLLYSRAEGLKSNFLMKKEWFFWPLGIIFRKIGGIPVWRDKHTNMTDFLSDTAKQEKTFRLCITPEGTRSLNPNWKKDSITSQPKPKYQSYYMALIMRKNLFNAQKALYPVATWKRK